MGSFFESLLSYIELAWSYFLNLINTLFTFITTLLGAVELPVLVAATQWAPIATCVVAVAGFSIIKIIIGRDNV